MEQIRTKLCFMNGIVVIQFTPFSNGYVMRKGQKVQDDFEVLNLGD